MSYELRILPKAAKYLKKIKENHLKQTFQEEVDQIMIEPYAGEAKIGDLSGIFCTSFFFNKSKYEIAYKIYEEPEQIVVLIHAGTRENFYEELKNYWKESK
jgi:mRNA interferase RelE/StbE